MSCLFPFICVICVICGLMRGACIFQLPQHHLPGSYRWTHSVFVDARVDSQVQLLQDMTETNTSHPVLLYDGLCGFCNKTIQLILRYDKRKTMLFAALQSDNGKAILARHPELEGLDSLVFVEPLAGLHQERVFVRSDGALQVASYLGGFWKLALAGYIIPRSIRDYLYDQFAKRRYRWFGKYDSCPLPPPDVRDRFLDL